MYRYTYHPDAEPASPEPVETRVKVLAQHLAEVLRENSFLRVELKILEDRIAELQATP